MSDDKIKDGKKKKKGGFFKRAFGFKSKEEKLAGAAALKAEQQAKVDTQMAERMAVINAAALKAAREQDEAHLSEAEKAKLEAEERKQAEAQALEDAKTAENLIEEKRQRALDAKRKAEEEAARLKAEAEETERLAVEKTAREKAEAEEIARLKQAEEKAKLEAEQQARLAEQKLAKTEADEAERLRTEAATAQKAREQAEKEVAERRETERLAAEQAETERLKAERVTTETQAAQAAKRKQLEAQLIKEQAEREQKAKLEREVWDAEQAAKRAEQGEPGFLGRISKGLSKSTSAMSDNISAVFTKRKLDAEALEDLEDLLIAADFGVGPATRTAELLAKDRFDKQVTDTEIKIALADVISEVLTPLEKPLVLTGAKPEIMLFVGVNGSGKTTTLGKIAKRYTDEGKKVLMAAGDTFRAAAVEQLKVWGERSGAPVVSAALGADASGLVYDAISRAKAENYDILMIDTAGRLQNRTELMDELAKIVRVIKSRTTLHRTIPYWFWTLQSAKMLYCKPKLFKKPQALPA